jgi:hypothetical protein
VRLSETSRRREVQAFRVPIGSARRSGMAFSKGLDACGTLSADHNHTEHDHARARCADHQQQAQSLFSIHRSRSRKCPRHRGPRQGLVRSDFIGSAPPHPTAFYIIYIALAVKAGFLAYACCHTRKSPASSLSGAKVVYADPLMEEMLVIYFEFPQESLRTLNLCRCGPRRDLSSD